MKPVLEQTGGRLLWSTPPQIQSPKEPSQLMGDFLRAPQEILSWGNTGRESEWLEQRACELHTGIPRWACGWGDTPNYQKSSFGAWCGNMHSWSWLSEDRGKHSYHKFKVGMFYIMFQASQNYEWDPLKNAQVVSRGSTDFGALITNQLGLSALH